MLRPRNLKFLGEGRHSDGNGLYLQVKGGSRVWVFRYWVDRKERWLGIGSLKVVDLQMARDEAVRLRRKVLAGEDLASSSVPVAPPEPHSLSDAIDYFYFSKSGSWVPKHRFDWLSFANRYIANTHGHMLLPDIDTKTVIGLIRGLPDSSLVLDRRVQRRLYEVFNVAIALGWRDPPNPARWDGSLEHLMPSRLPPPKHHSAHPYQTIPQFWQRLAKRDTSTSYALRFLILTAARTSEVREATWDEVCLAERIWTIPAARTKTRHELRVPLTDDMVQCLQRSAWDRGLLFPGADGPLNLSSILALSKRIDGRYTVHGFRSAFRDWVAEMTEYPGEIAEIALGHRIGRVEGAYRRGDQLEKRRVMMQEWCLHCTGMSRTC